MPTYDYRCPACEDVFEIVRPVGSTDEVRCASCDVPAKRVFTPVGVVFKGSGFHNTDYRSRPADDSAPKTAKTEGAPSAPACPAASGGGSCSSCPASKPEAS